MPYGNGRWGQLDACNVNEFCGLVFVLLFVIEIVELVMYAYK